MYEPFLDYARQSNADLVQRIYLEKQIKSLKPQKPSVKTRLLLKLSDALLFLGKRIRPREIQVYNEVKVEPSNHNRMYIDLSGCNQYAR